MRINRTLKVAVLESAILKHEMEQVLEERQKDRDILRERTEELSTHLDELEMVNKAFVGRELKMAELKREIEKLNKEQKP